MAFSDFSVMTPSSERVIRATSEISSCGLDTILDNPKSASFRWPSAPTENDQFRSKLNDCNSEVFVLVTRFTINEVTSHSTYLSYSWQVSHRDG